MLPKETSRNETLGCSFYQAAGYTVASLKLAKAALDHAMNTVISEMFDGNAEIIPARIKSDQRATDKWMHEKDGLLDSVTDIVATSALLPDLFSIRKAIENYGKKDKIFGQTKAGFIWIEKVNNAFMDDAYAHSQREHLKLKLVVSVPFFDDTNRVNTMKCEIQFRSARTESIYKESHKDYEALRPLLEAMDLCQSGTQQWQNLEEKARPIENRIRAAHQAANEKAGLYLLRPAAVPQPHPVTGRGLSAV